MSSSNNSISSSIDSALLETLIRKAHESKQFSHSEYSQFRVGCALLTKDGTIYTGCNVENASYGLAICAERTALCKAVSEGHRQFQVIVVSTDVNAFISPCGACRQFIAEFGLDWQVVMTKADSLHEYSVHTVRDILPFAFDKAVLGTAAAK